VLEGISLSMPERSVVAVLGRNGVGKTTLLSTIMGLTRIEAGRVLFRGKDLAPVPVYDRTSQGIGLVPQEREIFASLTTHENLTVAVRPGEWTVSRIYELFPALAARRKNYGNQLSGGEQQMLAMGRALVSNPSMLLLDEPFEGLAPVIVDRLVEVLARIRQESAMAMLLVEHNVELALDFADRAMILDRGQIAWIGDSAALRSDRDRLANLIGLQQQKADP
jgi:branched-chain amino acid transport system ATP-binding protein